MSPARSGTRGTRAWARLRSARAAAVFGSALVLALPTAAPANADMGKRSAARAAGRAARARNGAAIEPGPRRTGAEIAGDGAGIRAGTANRAGDARRARVSIA